MTDAQRDAFVPNRPPSPRPGWYHDGRARRRWDGKHWGEYASADSAVSPDDRTLAILVHFGGFAGGFLVPLTLHLIARSGGRPQLRWHAREALNFQLTWLLVAVVAVVVAAESPEVGWLAAIVGVGFGVLGVVCSVVGAVRANAGVRWRYPMRIPFVTR